MGLSQVFTVALNPKIGDGFVERFGSLLALLVWVLMSLSLFFGVVPDETASQGAYGVLSLFVGGVLRHQSDE